MSLDSISSIAPRLSSMAPGLHWSLSRTTPDSMEFLERAFTLALANGGGGELGVVRPAGASFNPRPARFCQILLSESRETDPIVLAAAFLCSVPEFPSLVEPDLIPALDLCKQAQEFRYAGCTNDAAERLALVACLDELRHLHMRAPESVDVDGVLAAAQELLSRLRHNSRARLSVLVAACIERSSQRKE